MKNHVIVDGKLLQTNKKWSALKQSQREWIHNIVREEHAVYVTVNERLPMKKRKDEIITRCHSRLDERGIWIPYGEFCSHVNKQLDRLNRSKEKLFGEMVQQVEIYYKMIGYVELPEMSQAEKESYMRSFGRMETDRSA